MLSEEVFLSLGPFDLALPLGSYLILFKYAYVLAYVLWAVWAARRQSARVVLAGTLVLGALGLVVVQAPLGRAYGLEEGSALLPAVADAMVVAAGASPFDGWQVGVANDHPGWSALLAALSGFEPLRLLSMQRCVGFLAIGFFCGATLLGLARLETVSLPPLSRALALFFALFLSSGQLDFLYLSYIPLPHVLFVEPRLAVSLPGALLAGGLLLSPLRSGRILGALALGAIAYLDAVCWISTASAVALALAGPGIERRFESLAAAAAGIALGSPMWTSLPGVAGADVSLATTVLFPSPVPILALLALVGLLRRREAAHRFGLFLVAGAAVAVVLGSAIGPVLLRYLLAVLAGYGFAFLVFRAKDALFPARPRLPLAVGLLVLLPFTFFYWWQPRTMDPWFGASLAPVSPRLENLAGWIRESTPEETVVLVFRNLGPWLPAFTGRRVVVAPDEDVEYDEGDRLLDVARKSGATHAVILRADLERLPHLRELVSTSEGLTELHAVARWARVYALSRDD
jgi:hypothetical protein